MSILNVILLNSIFYLYGNWEQKELSNLPMLYNYLTSSSELSTTKHSILESFFCSTPSSMVCHVHVKFVGDIEL